MCTRAPAFGWTSAHAKVRASSKTLNNFATSCCKRAGNSTATSTTSALKAPSTTKRLGPSASAHSVNFCIQSARPKYNPHLSRGGWLAFPHPPDRFQRSSMPESRSLTILCVSSYEKGQEFLRTCKAIGCRVLLLTVERLRDAD